MCGIAGWIGPVERRDAVRRMHEAMRHRGPDGDGLWFSDDETVGLAHRRLAILAPGPQAGQPMASGGHRIVFNGEIYNHAALRAGMERDRHGMEADESPAAGRRRPRRPVLLMAPTFGNERGGIQEFTREIVRALKAGDGLANVVALSYNGTPPDENGFAEWTDCGTSTLRGATFFFQALRLCIKWRPRVILSTFPGFAPVGVACAKFSGIPFATVAHGIEVWKRMSAEKRTTLCVADRVLAVSNFTAERLIQVNGVPPDRIRIFPNTVDSDKFFPGPKPGGLAKSLGIPAGVPVLLTVARLDVGECYKGVERVWDAMLTRAEGPLAAAVHVVAGSGSDLERLRAEALRRGLGDRVRFSGPVSGAELAALYRLADAFVMPSTKEGFGIVFLEAMASGIPVVAADAGGSPDALLDGKLGWLADPDSVESLADSIEDALAGDPADPRRNPKFLRSSVVSHFGRDSFRARLEAELRELAG